jgi:hypothetical protein
MKRRSFISNNLAFGAMIPASYASIGYTQQKTNHPSLAQEEVVIETS